MYRNILISTLLFCSLAAGVAFGSYPDALRPDGLLDSNNITRIWQTGDTSQNYHRIITAGNSIFVANDSTLIQLILPILYDNYARLHLLPGKPDLFDTVRVITTIKMPGHIEDIAFADSLLLVALGKNGFQVYVFRDVFAPQDAPKQTQLVLKNSNDTFDAYSFALTSDHIFVGCGDGLRSYYYDQLGFLRSDGIYTAAGDNRHVAIAYNNSTEYALLEDDGAGYRVFDVTNMPNLSFRGWLPTPAAPRGIVIRDTFAFTIDRDFGYRIYDINDPQQTKLLGNYALPGEPKNFILTDPYGIAFIADGDYGLRIIAAAEAGHPHELGYYDTPGTALDVALVSDSLNLVMVADGRYLALYNFTEAVPYINDYVAYWYPSTLNKSDLYYAGYDPPEYYPIPISPVYPGPPHWRPRPPTHPQDTLKPRKPKPPRDTVGTNPNDAAPKPTVDAAPVTPKPKPIKKPVAARPKPRSDTLWTPVVHQNIAPLPPPVAPTPAPPAIIYYPPPAPAAPPVAATPPPAPPPAEIAPAPPPPSFDKPPPPPPPADTPPADPPKKKGD